MSAQRVDLLVRQAVGKHGDRDRKYRASSGNGRDQRTGAFLGRSRGQNKDGNVAILLDEISDVSDATRVADRIEHELEAPFSIGASEVFTTARVVAQPTPSEPPNVERPQ